MADKVYPDTHTRITAGLLRKSRRHMVEISSGSGLIATPNDGANNLASDNTTVLLDGSNPRVTWSTYSGIPDWASVTGGPAALDITITEPGLYLSVVEFNVFVDPTTANVAVLVDGGPGINNPSVNASDLAAAAAIGGGNFPNTPPEAFMLDATDVPWTMDYRIRTGVDSGSGELIVTVNIQQIGHF